MKLFIMQFSPVSVLKIHLVFFVLTSRRTLQVADVCSSTEETGSWYVQFNWRDR